MGEGMGAAGPPPTPFVPPGYLVLDQLSYPESKLSPEVSSRPLRMFIGSGCSLDQVSLSV